MPRTLMRTIDAPFGKLTLEVQDDALTALRFGSVGADSGDFHEVLDCAAQQLEEYFSGARCAFSVPVRLNGTEFQKKVWRALMDVEYGKTATYSEIARRIGYHRAFRAVGMANHVNPIPIIIPCHRIIGKNGSLTGYAGDLEIKQWLLNLEKQEN